MRHILSDVECAIFFYCPAVAVASSEPHERGPILLLYDLWYRFLGVLLY